MTIINHPSDGLYPELIALARLVAYSGEIGREELIRCCQSGNPTRLGGALSRWTTLGLFTESQGLVSVGKTFVRKRGEPIDNWTERLRGFCCHLMLAPDNCQPLFGDNEGVSADFVRGIAWLLAQDIFSLPTAWTEVERMQYEQVSSGAKIIQNDARWSGLRFWARYLGFATGDSRSFLIDPTSVIRSELHTIYQGATVLPAMALVSELAKCLPILDSGTYRQEVERQLKEAVWRRPETGHLSMSLSFALRRLELEHVIALESMADTGQGVRLTGKDHQSRGSFTHVRLVETRT